VECERKEGRKVEEVKEGGGRWRKVEEGRKGGRKELELR
jgi:hypothetical protein